MPDATYLRYRDDLEVRQPNEDEDTADAIGVFAQLARFSFDKHRHAVRPAHGKSHAILRGELTVSGGLSEELAQGLFRAPGTYPVMARLSTAPGDLLPDGVSSFRGLAIKVLSVDGPRLLPEPADARTQDFLLINHPAFPAADISAFLAGLRRMEKLAHTPEELQEALTTGAQLGAGALRRVGIDVAGTIGQAKPHTHPLGDTYFTTAPLRHGDYVAKLSVVPDHYPLRALVGQPLDVGEDSAIRDAVVDYFRTHDAEYEVRAQLCTDLETMPVEDASVRWPEEASAYRTVARLRFPAQEAYSHARRVYGDDLLSFTPWNGLAAHRPLGSVMRARRSAYEAASRARHERNVRPRGEPRSIDELPD